MRASDLASAFAVYMSSPCLLAAPAVPVAANDTRSTQKPSARRRMPTPLPSVEPSLSGTLPHRSATRNATDRLADTVACEHDDLTGEVAPHTERAPVSDASARAGERRPASWVARPRGRRQVGVPY